MSFLHVSATLLVHLCAAVHQSQPPCATTHAEQLDNVEQSVLAPLTIKIQFFVTFIIGTTQKLD